MFIGAHPDDADIEFGGTAIKFLSGGHRVTYVAMTNGDAGHFKHDRQSLARIRKEETEEVAQFLGLNYIVLDNRDTELEATIENRNNLIALVRKVKPHLIVTHRLNDYHTDHRATSLIVQNAAYLFAVPQVVSTVPRIDYNPVILFHQDNFQRPYPFSPTVFVDITDVIDRKMEALMLHKSQVFEWLPFIYKTKAPDQSNKKACIEWLKSMWGNPGKVNRFLPQVKKLVGKETIEFIEAFELSEYGGQLTEQNALTIFPLGIFT